MDRKIIETALLAHIAALGPDKTVCPSEIAKALTGQATDSEWRALLKPVRATAVALAQEGRIGVYRKGKPVADPSGVKGVIRLGAPSTDQQQEQGDEPSGTGAATGDTGHSK